MIRIKGTDSQDIYSKMSCLKGQTHEIFTGADKVTIAFTTDCKTSTKKLIKSTDSKYGRAIAI